MKAVAYIELIILVRVILGAITFRNALISPIIYGHFLRQRYYQSAFTRDAVIATNQRIDQFVRRPGNPPMLVTVWEWTQAIVQRWAGSTLVQNSNAGQVPRR